MAKDGMNFDKYIDNPSGGSSVITNRKMYKELYKSKFGAILLREEGKIDYTVYKDSKSKDDSHYIHIKIPSEVIPKFYYDVVIRLSTVEETKKASSNLRAYQAQFYSNDPAFVYTFVHAFNANNMFIKDLEKKMSKTALKTLAKTKNPKDEIFYVKSLYFAYLVMEKEDLFNRLKLKKLAKPYDKKQLLDSIEYAEDKIKARQEAEENLKKEEADKKRKEVQQRNDNRNINHKPKISKVSNVTKTSRTSKITKTSKTTKVIGRHS